ncbi:hypothetical protein PS15m_009074 [Mucor circinelloides]
MHQVSPRNSRDPVQYLRNEIAILEAQVQKSNATNKTTTNPLEVEGQQVKRLDPVFMKRRRRNKFTRFERGTPHEAQQQLNRYEVLVEYLGSTEKKKKDELVVVFNGNTLDWFIGLESSILLDWKEVKAAFLHMHTHGSDPTLIAYDKLKVYKQDDKPMKVFGPKITGLLQRAMHIL